MKIRWDGQQAAEVFVYVDDGRPTGPMEFLTWQAGRAYDAGCTRRGVQDASRKRTSPSQTPGPWAGTVTHTDGGEVCGMVSQEKWDKTKRLIGDGGDVGPGLFAPDKAFADQGVPDVCCANVPVDQSLHEGATSHHRQLAAF
jgi:hypothetical protein